MLINFSNHPSQKWSEPQRAAAETYGEIKDIAFPEVPASADKDEIYRIAKDSLEIIKENHPDAVMVQGEMTLTFALVSLLQQEGIKAVAAASERKAIESIGDNGETIRRSEFHFVRFREY